MSVLRWVALVSVLGLTACTTSTRYYWGTYETSVYRLEIKSDDPGVVQQSIDTLNEDLEKARSQDLPVPPGFHAHLGYLYTLQGNLGHAIGHFRQEKTLYPESTQFIDGLLARLKVGS